MHPRTALLAAGFCALLILAAPGVASAQDTPPAGEETPPEPAPLNVEKILEGVKSKLVTERLAAAEAAVENQDRKLLKPLVGLLKDESDTVREASIQALGSRTGDDRKPAATALAGRLKSLAKNRVDEPELLSVITSLHDLAQPCAIKELMADMDVGTSPEVVSARLFAVGNTPCDEAIESLIGEMSSGRRRGSNARATAVQALRYATGQEFRHDPDEWRAWWKDVKKGYDHGKQYRRRAGDRADAEDREREKEEAKKRRAERQKERERREKEGDGREKRDADPGGNDKGGYKDGDGDGDGERKGKGKDGDGGKGGGKGGGRDKGDRAD